MMNNGTILCSFVLLSISLLAVSLLMLRKVTSDVKVTCDTIHHLNTLTSYIYDNGAKSLENEISQTCTGDKINNDLLEQFKLSLSNVVQSCKTEDFARNIPVNTPESPILTLFTTWSNRHKQLNFTLINWGTLTPLIDIVLFTNDEYITKAAVTHGWKVFPIIHQGVEGLPILKSMFSTVMRNNNSTFYGYANGDVLFTDDIFENLRYISKNFQSENILITGRRTNVNDLSLKEVASYDNLRKAASERGEMFIVSSEEYFITTKQFPWHLIPDLVVGRRAFDNWIVGYSRCNGVKVIDLSRTLLAVHQTILNENNESHKKNFPDYNDQLLKSLQLKPVYETGFTSCIELYSYRTLCSNIDVTIRQNTPAYCSCSGA